MSSRRVYVVGEAILAETDNAILLGVGTKQCWIPKSVISGMESNILDTKFRVNIPQWMADKLDIRYKYVKHVPDKMKPKHHEAIDEVRFNSE